MPVVVYYDGACPLCRREMAYYQRLPTVRPVVWQDLSVDTACGDGLSCEMALKRFHVRDANGALSSGAAAFSLVWRCLAGWRWLGWVSAVPPFSWLAEVAYCGFLKLRPRLQAWAPRGKGSSC